MENCIAENPDFIDELNDSELEISDEPKRPKHHCLENSCNDSLIDQSIEAFLVPQVNNQNKDKLDRVVKNRKYSQAPNIDIINIINDEEGK